MSKKIILIVIAIVITGGLGYWIYQSTLAPQGITEAEACLKSGGQITTSLCCKSTGDYPNLCLIGPCGCSPDNSHEVKICDCGEGKCFDGNTCVPEVYSFNDCIKAGYPVMESYPRQCKTPDGKTFTEDIGNVLEKLDLIKIDNPRPNQAIENPLFIKGEARGFWFFEASFPVKLFDDNGFLLGVTPAQALGDWMIEDFVAFDATLPFAVPSSPKGRLVLEKDNPSGLPEHADELIIPIHFKEASEVSQEFMAIKIFLSDSRFVNEPYFDCSRTIAVERRVPKTLAVAKSAVEALLRGATQEEINQGFVSNINSGARIQSLTIENSIAKVGFEEQLEFQVGGSCRVAAIRAQITETLKQFQTVDAVIISINGRTEDILQP